MYKLYTRLWLKPCNPYMLPILNGSFGVYSLVAWTNAPVPRARLHMKFCDDVMPCQPVVRNETKAPLKLPQPMLALSPTPPDIWPLQPKVPTLPAGEPGTQVAAIGLFNMLRGKLNPGVVPPPGAPLMPPLSRADQRLQTCWFAK